MPFLKVLTARLREDFRLSNLKIRTLFNNNFIKTLAEPPTPTPLPRGPITLLFTIAYISYTIDFD